MAPKKGSTTRSNPFFVGVEDSDYRGQSARWAHDGAESVGASLLGTLVGVKSIKFKDGKEGSALVFSPAVELTPDGEIVAHRTIETINSATLGQKITPETDKGTTFAIELTGYEKSEHKGRADFKQFRVAPVNPDVLRKHLTDLGESTLAAIVATNAE